MKNNICLSYWQVDVHRVRLFPAVLGVIPDYCCQRD